MKPDNDRETPFWQALLPILFLLGLVVYGLVLRRQYFGQPDIPLEIIFILAAVFTVTQLLVTGHRWSDIQATIVEKLAAC